MGLANRLHQVWLDGAIQAIAPMYKQLTGKDFPSATWTYGYSKRPRPENRYIGISQGKKQPIVSIHPGAWSAKLTVIAAVFDAARILTGKPEYQHLEQLTTFRVTLAQAMPDLPGNTDRLAPPSKGRMLLFTCEKCGNKIRSGRKDLFALCRGTQEKAHDEIDFKVQQ